MFRSILSTISSAKPVGLSLFRRNISEYHKALEENARVHAKMVKKWKYIFYLICVPSIIYLSITCIGYEVPLENPDNFIDYPHLRQWRKAFPWRDGKTPMFFNERMYAYMNEEQLEEARKAYHEQQEMFERRDRKLNNMIEKLRSIREEAALNQK